MTITRLSPGTIYLGGPRVEIGDVAAGETITPGHLVERYNDSGTWRWKKHATAGGPGTRAVAIEQAMVNKSISEDYSEDDLMEVVEGAGGTSFLMFVASGQTIVHGDKLESAGNGTLRKLDSGEALFAALESITATALTRIRVEVV